MDQPFHARFDISVGLEDAQRRFVNRVHNEIWNGLVLGIHSDSVRYQLQRYVVSRLGDKYVDRPLYMQVGDAFQRNLEAIEHAYEFLRNADQHDARRLDQKVVVLLHISEADLGLHFRSGKFYPAGAELLDDRLVNDQLNWLREGNATNVLVPFEKGLRHLLLSRKDPQVLPDVITDMYEALEALSKNVLKNDSDLSRNREAFIAAVKASEPYKKMLKQYIEYANDFRHASQASNPKPSISAREAENFVYLTGVFIRLAMPNVAS